MSDKKLQLLVVSQDKQLLDMQVDSVTAPASEGEMTILPEHIPLFSPLQAGELTYRTGQEEHTFVVSKGFIDVAPDSTITVMVDTAVHARDISEQKAQEAVKAAETTLAQSADRAELVRAEAELRRALLELKVAQRTKKTTL